VILVSCVLGYDLQLGTDPSEKGLFLDLDAKCPTESQCLLNSLFILLFYLQVLLYFLLLYLLQIFNFVSWYTFALESAHFSLFIFLPTYPTWTALCMNAIACSTLSHFWPTALFPLIHSHSIGNSASIFSLIPREQRKSALSCANNYFICMVLLSKTQQLSCRIILWSSLAFYFSQ
jgi:hypothetical protein